MPSGWTARFFRIEEDTVYIDVEGEQTEAW